MTAIKICGLSRTSDIEAANRLHPDYIGFVFADSHRQISEEQAQKLREKLDPTIQTVGVFVNEDIQRIVELCQQSLIDLVQLHGDEDGDYIRQLKDRIPNKIIKAVRVRDRKDVEASHDYDCDYILFDSFRYQTYGGSGTSFDWSLLSNVEKPFFLAGGLHYDNISKAIQQCNPYCVDVSSGVESGGVKDPEKMMEFMTRIKSLRR